RGEICSTQLAAPTLRLLLSWQVYSVCDPVCTITVLFCRFKGLAQWLESDFVCGRDGKRILAHWKLQGRGRVDLNRLQQWYRTLDELLARKKRIEVELFGRLRDLFHLQVEMVFYDLTSTYFEGRGPAGLAEFGYMLRQWGQGYLVGLKRRRNEQVNGYIEAAAQGPWQECPVGISAPEKEKVPRTMVTEVAGEEPGVRVFVVRSEERLAYERDMREAAMERTRQALEKLSLRVAAGRLKKAQKIGEAAA